MLFFPCRGLCHACHSTELWIIDITEKPINTSRGSIYKFAFYRDVGADFIEEVYGEEYAAPLSLRDCSQMMSSF